MEVKVEQVPIEVYKNCVVFECVEKKLLQYSQQDFVSKNKINSVIVNNFNIF